MNSFEVAETLLKFGWQISFQWYFLTTTTWEGELFMQNLMEKQESLGSGVESQGCCHSVIW